MRRILCIIAVFSTCLTLTIVRGQETVGDKKGTAGGADKTPLTKMTVADLEKKSRSVAKLI